MKILWLLFFVLHQYPTLSHRYFAVKEVPYRRLCQTKNILTVNGKFPGPTLYVQKGDTIYVYVHNKGRYNITIHWHGVKQPRNSWTDGPEYITQCPVQPGTIFKQKLIFSKEEGTLWWHAHSSWSRATVHGAIIVYPKIGTAYPFPTPHQEVPIISGEWWNKDVNEVYKLFLETGGNPEISDTLTINGQPADLYPCSKPAMNIIFFFAVSNHELTVVGTDGCYTKPLTRNYIVISPGQTIDILLYTNQLPNSYYIAGRAYSTGRNVSFDSTTTTAIVQYNSDYYAPYPSPSLPYLPHYNDTNAAFDFITSLRSLVHKDRPIDIPKEVTTQLVSTVSVNAILCPLNQSCDGPNGTRLLASMNNIRFALPMIDILEAYYYHIHGVFESDFPNFPPFLFNFTDDYLPLILEIPKRGTKVKFLEYGSAVEIVLQGTNLVAGIDHPMHIHGFSFYVVGSGFGNFDKEKDLQRYNLVDPRHQNTVIVPKNGWIAIRFWATNPGVWFMHCHMAHHLSWGLNTVFIVKNGKCPVEMLLPPPPYMPPC